MENQTEVQTVTEPTTAAVTEPTTETVTEPTTAAVTELTTETVTESTTAAVTEPTTETGSEPTIETVTDPITVTYPITSEPTTEISVPDKVFDVELDARYSLITGTVTAEGDVLLYEKLENIETYQLQQLELLEKEIEIQQNMYTVTSYLFVAVLAFALIKFFSSFFNSVITF